MAKINIESDGSRKGTSLKVDGKEVKNFTRMMMSCWEGSDKMDFNYTTKKKDDKSGMMEEKTMMMAEVNGSLAMKERQPNTVKVKKSGS